MKKLILTVILCSPFLAFAQNQTQHLQPNYTMQTDTDSGISYPRLANMANIKAEQNINILLTMKQKTDIENYKTCFQDNANPQKSYWHEKVEILTLTPAVLSLKINYSYYCGGSYPDEHNEYLTYDLSKGSAFDFTAFFKPTAETAIRKMALQAYQQEILNKKANTECLTAYEPTENRAYQLAFSSKGLLFILEVPHAMQLCAKELTFPYGKILPLVNKNSIKILKTISM